MEAEELDSTPGCFYRMGRAIRKLFTLRPSLGATQSRQNWKLSLFILGGAVVGLIVYFSLYAVQTTNATGNTGR
jgi:hypothetical protein